MEARQVCIMVNCNRDGFSGSPPSARAGQEGETNSVVDTCHRRADVGGGIPYNCQSNKLVNETPS